MSLVALSLNLLLAALLLCALVIGVRLERRLKAVRDGQLAFVVAISELDAAAHKAKEGLAELRGATDEATDVLGGRIARAREAADRLERLVGRAEAAPAQAAPPAPAAGPEGGLAALLERIKHAEIAPSAPAALERAGRARPSVDDELFEDFGGRP